ncbi:MAG: hypothetical protein IPL21_16095 [Saprospirales bacterium]|nr:hypothetical protein [Saprospirales bacterium]
MLIAPSIIVYNKFDNKFENWEDLGNWISKLNVGRDSLSSEIKNKLIDLSKNEQSTSGKINIVYKYLQSITRYVSIQFGIGGLQPQFAQKTIENGYGDCKALSMLMIALLKAIDIKAYYTLVKAGDNENIIKEFPSNQFNHAIVCVPLNKDTLWLECTDQNIQFNYLSDFTDDRDVFVIAEKPFITHTKTYTQQENYIKTIGQISIAEMGDAKCNLIKEAGFLASDNLFTIKNTVSSKTKEELITKLFNFKI